MEIIGSVVALLVACPLTMGYLWIRDDDPRAAVIGTLATLAVVGMILAICWKVSKGGREKAVEIDYERQEVRFIGCMLHVGLLPRRRELLVKRFDQVLGVAYKRQGRGFPNCLQVTLDRGRVHVSELHSHFNQLWIRLEEIAKQSPEMPVHRRGWFVWLVTLSVIAVSTAVIVWLAWEWEWI